MKKVLKTMISISLTMGLAVSTLLPVNALEQRTNYALNKDVTVSYAYSNVFDGKLAVDGKDDTRWASEPYGSDQWLRVDLGEEKTFSEFVILNENSDNQKIKKFKIEGSHDDQSYEMIYDSPTKNEGFDLDNTVVLNQEVTYRYVKITIESLIDGAYNSISLREFEIIGYETIAEVDKTELQKAYDEYKGHTPVYMNSSSYLRKYNEAVTEAKTVLDNEKATQDDVDKALILLKNRYWFVTLQEYVYHYSPTRNNFNYSLYETSSIVPLLSAYYKGSNYSTSATGEANTNIFIELCQKFSDGENNLIIDSGKTGIAVGVNGYETETNAEQKQGTLTLTEEIVKDSEGKKSLQMTVRFENNGINPFSKETASTFSYADMNKAQFTLHYETLTQKQGSFTITQYMTYDSAKGVYEGSFNVDEILDQTYKVEDDYPGYYYVDMTSGSVALYSLGLYRTTDYTKLPADKEELEDLIAEAEAISLDLYTEQSVNELVTQLDAAEDIDNDVNVTQEIVDEMVELLRQAINDLVYKSADYTKVDEALEKVNALDKSLYKDFSGVEAAVQAVQTGLDITKQAEVDAMAQAIEDAIAKLEKKDHSGSIVVTNPDHNQSQKPDNSANNTLNSTANTTVTGDTTQIASTAALAIISFLSLFILKRKK